MVATTRITAVKKRQRTASASSRPITSAQARYGRQQQLVEVALLDVGDDDDAGDAGCAGDSLHHRDRNLEAEVVVYTEGVARDGPDRTDGHEQEEQRDEEVPHLLTGTAYGLAQPPPHDVVTPGEHGHR
jgi:hypothetical protein